MLRRIVRWTALGILLQMWPVYAAFTQELEPRAYSPSPLGTNFLLLSYAYSEGDILTDPSIPVTNVDARIDSYLLGYARTLGVFGRAVNVGAVVPLFDANVKGDVFEEAAQVKRSGIGDSRLRVATNIIGGEALTREEFALRRPDTIVGTSLTLTAPTGQYNSERLINIGTNRWAFKPEIGASRLIGDFFIEGAAALSFFTDNPNFFGDVEREQDPLTSVQFHGGYTFRPGLWLAFDATYYTGGRTTVAGVEKDDSQENSRYGLTLAIPLSQEFAVKLSWSEAFATKLGGDFTTFGATLQYRWFDD